jgi:hypothetical protein
MMSSNEVHFQINSRVGRKLHTKFGVDPTVSEFSTIFFKKNPRLYLAAVTSSSVTSHRAYHRTISGWQETATPSLAQIGQFFNFLRFFFKAKSASNPTAVTSSMMSSNQVYFQINSNVARNLHAKFSMNGTVPEFFTIFSSSKHHPKWPW